MMTPRDIVKGYMDSENPTTINESATIKNSKYYMKNFIKYVVNQSMRCNTFKEFKIIDSSLNVLLENFNLPSVTNCNVTNELIHIIEEADKVKMSDDEFIDKVKGITDIEDVIDELRNRTAEQITASINMNQDYYNSLQKMTDDIEEKIIDNEIPEVQQESYTKEMKNTIFNIFKENLNVYDRISLKIGETAINENMLLYQENGIINKDIVKNHSLAIYSILESFNILNILDSKILGNL